ncbi:MAG: endolytic transglycosylase MltG [Ignavibacteria bacterium]|nr:endolytic transglycosylase MltG [Ignavibacteria bacterium]
MQYKAKKIFARWDVLSVLAVFILLLVVFYLTFFTPNYYSIKSPVQFDIRRGESFSEITERLHERKIIPSETNFRIAAFIYGAEKNIRAARFYIPNGLSYLDLLDLFISGECNHLKSFTLNSGQTIKWLGHRLQKYILIDSIKFVERAKDEAFTETLGLNQKSFEGYLFPTDYELYEKSSPEETINLFYSALKTFYSDSLLERTEHLGFNVHEILTLASIVKGETDKVDEMPTIAGVYHNRLRIGMKLQADPTIQYLLPDGWRRLTYNDLKIDSPYNTYKYFGLPPAPINSPGKRAILAALYPEKHDYLYFVADGKGGHWFSKNHREHINNVKKYRKWLKE